MTAQPQMSEKQPQMSEKLRARMQKGAESLMEPDETVLYGVNNLTMPMWVYGAFIGIALLPYVIMKASIAVVTERNVYVFKTNGFGFKARRVLLKAPLGSIEATVEGNAFPGRALVIGDQKLWLHFRRTFQERARAIADAASSGTSAVTPAAAAAPATAAEPATTVDLTIAEQQDP
jgi:hypothetical protein